MQKINWKTWLFWLLIIKDIENTWRIQEWRGSECETNHSLVGSNDKKGHRRKKLNRKENKCLGRESMTPAWKSNRIQIDLPKEWMASGCKERRCCFPFCLEQSKTTTAAAAQYVTTCYGRVLSYVNGKCENGCLADDKGKDCLDEKRC